MTHTPKQTDVQGRGVVLKDQSRASSHMTVAPVCRYGAKKSGTRPRGKTTATSSRASLCTRASEIAITIARTGADEGIFRAAHKRS